jgi:hypothetical protein
MGEVVDEHVRFGCLIVAGVKASGTLLMFSQELTRPLDLGGKHCDSVREWIHWSGSRAGLAQTAALLVGKQKTKWPCQKLRELLVWSPRYGVGHAPFEVEVPKAGGRSNSLRTF